MILDHSGEILEKLVPRENPKNLRLMLAQVPTSMVVPCSQIELSWRIPILRYGPKREIRRREAHFRAYFNGSYLVFGNRYRFSFF